DAGRQSGRGGRAAATRRCSAGHRRSPRTIQRASSKRIQEARRSRDEPDININTRTLEFADMNSLAALRAQRINALLTEHYPNAGCALHYENPLQLLVATILSAQCTDVC